jgi:hypothetical protein
MSISLQISEDIKNAMRAKDSVALNVVRGLKSAFKYAAIEKHGADGDLSDEEAVVVIRKEVKKRQDSIESFVSAGRNELADAEKAELAILMKYLPQQMSVESVVELVSQVLTELGVSSKKDMGMVMKVLQERSGGNADGKMLAAELAKRLS